MDSRREDQSGLEHSSFVLLLIFITFLIYIILTTIKISVEMQKNVCLHVISVDKDIKKNEWQMNQIELIRKALSGDHNIQQSTSKQRSFDVAEGPGFKSTIVQRKYDATLMDTDTYQGTEAQEEVERSPGFYLKSKFATKIGSVYFRLTFIQKFSRWFVLWYRSNSQIMGSTAVDMTIKDTYMKVVKKIRNTFLQ